MTQSSCLYIGQVLHRRVLPRRHRLRYRVFWMLLDLDEIEALSAQLGFFSHNRFNLTSFVDSDHGDGSDVPLRKQAEALLRRAGCRTDALTIKLLCMPRILGYGFNPLSTYFCFRIDGSLEAVIYEVHNTFGERHSYVMPVRSHATATVEQNCPKAFYVSPFLGMDMTYAFRILPPASRVKVTIQGKEQGKTVIAASLSGARREMTDGALMSAFASHPLLTLKVIAGIHWHALRMVLKGFRLHARSPAQQGAIKAAGDRGVKS
ncbi:hypothetical protein PMI42_04309 [Bradyrhizobium sp. YR681]|uniref:DUF1365 domain-containing protein n=1 Tax=Bradyrhizobium sp. YR681 TaxID=1144344 RepID=UPI0002711C10|nr:DUF1365 family protein [Bradyrhizobium sp. YR681]EJN12337.1 hypothetical protein PMI42_04309 [Bradyrhizobium sp. YR681]